MKIHVDDSSSYTFEMDNWTMNSIILQNDGIRYGTCRLKGISFSCSLDLGWYKSEVDILLQNHTKVSHVSNEMETYFTYTTSDSSLLSRFIIYEGGIFNQLIWLEDSQIWMPSKLRLADTYCNQLAKHNHNRSHDCACSSASEPSPTKELILRCASQTLFQCHNEGFIIIPNSFSGAACDVLSPLGNTTNCKTLCEHYCSCQAYYRIENACAICNENTLNLQCNPAYNILYVIATKPKSRLGVLALVASLGTIGLIITLLILISKFRSTNKSLPTIKVMDDSLMLIKYRALRNATSNFSLKLGEGAFGCVYQGIIPNTSQGIAVKHLKICNQGDKQFRAEVSTLGIVHHVNLVRLIGFCAEGSKRFLVYEYMQQGSLDKHIFGDGIGTLDWKIRFPIGLGIAKGMAYLHHECRECIIHCDLKPENILPDEDFDQKISDFALAKLLGRDFSRILTTMRGTRGYLAPEWISGLAVTSKVDVYTDGMMLFEIISGKRNWSMRINEENDYMPLLILQKLTIDGDIKSVLDTRLADVDSYELVRVCRVAGWCIQEDEKDRLSMMDVVRILEGNQDMINPPIPGYLLYMTDIQQESTAYHSCITE